ncbi:MAG: cupin domain-containing protein [Propioniciclava sp.]
MAVYRSNDLTVEERPIGGGETDIVFRHYIPKEKLYDHGRLFAHLTVPVGGVVGVHEHPVDAEYYVIHSGRGRYQMDDQTWEVGPGDVAEVAPGHRHGITNIGPEPLTFTALIVNA